MKKRIIKISSFFIIFGLIFSLSAIHSFAYVNKSIRYNPENYESYTENTVSMEVTFLIQDNYLLASFPFLDYDDINIIKTANYNYENGINATHYYELDSVISINGVEIIETWNSEDIIEQGEVLYFKSSLARYSSNSTITFIDFMINEYYQGHDDGNAYVYIFGAGEGIDVVTTELAVQKVTKSSANKLQVVFNKAYLKSIYNGVKYIIVNGVKYTDISVVIDTVTGLATATVNDYEVVITKDVKNINVSEIGLSLVGSTNTGVLKANYNLCTTTQVTHQCATMTPYIANKTIINPLPGAWFGKVYKKAVYFNYVNSETGEKIENLYQVQCKYTYDESELVTVKQDVGGTMKEVSFDYAKLSKDGILGTPDSRVKDKFKEKWGFECDYLWYFFTQKKISDFRLIYAWYENETGIIQGSSYENGMYSVVDENGNEVVYDIYGNLVTDVKAENGVIKDLNGNEIEVAEPSIPEDGDEWDDSASWYDKVIESIQTGFASFKNIFSGITSFFKKLASLAWWQVILILIAIVAVIGLVKTFGPKLIFYIVASPFYLLAYIGRFFKTLIGR